MQCILAFLTGRLPIHGEPTEDSLHQEDDSLMQKTYSTFAIILILTILAAIPRFYDLGSLGFYGDEKTTAPPSRSYAEGKGARMPSGMSYYRALPQTWLSALSAKVFGLENEISYRIPSAIIGSLTVPLIFILARPIFGFAIALVAALMLCFSEWHILVSREARMYAPFLFFYVASSLSIWRWASTGVLKYLFLGTIFFIAAVTFHYLAIILGLLFIIPIAFPKWTRVPSWQLLAFALSTSIAAQFYSEYVSSAPFTEWLASHGGPVTPSISDSATEHSWLPRALASYPKNILFWGVLIGAVLGSWCVRLSQPIDTLPGHSLRTLAFYILGISSGSLALIGQLYGASITCLLFFLIHPDNGFSIIKKIRIPGAIIILSAMAWVLKAFLEYGLYEGLKSLVAFPFAYPAFLAQMLPGASVLFVGMCIYVVLYPQKSPDYSLRASTMAALVPIFGIGVMKEWGGIRYLIESYPFLIFVASAGLLRLSGYICQPFKTSVHRKVLPLTIMIVLSGILGGHGLPQALGAANLNYGESVRSFPFEYYPDHKGAGEFVRNQRTSGDIVIAEDSLVQYWYSGSIDYCLRGPQEAQFFHRALDGVVRDIYVNSVPATTDILDTIAQSSKRIWLITSAELSTSRKFILGDEQLEWLADIESRYTPVFVGRDNVTKVYCLNCDDNTSQ